MKRQDIKTEGSEKLKRTRMHPHEREEQILTAAIEFFADFGPSGQTRELAKKLGVTQGLIYRYFKDKEELLNRVYQDVFEARWSPRWETLLKDKNISLRTRLIKFYTQYVRIIHRREWVRIYILAALEEDPLQQKYRNYLRQSVFPIIAEEMQFEFNIGADEKVPAMQENEMITVLHGMFFYIGIRQWVYKTNITIEMDEQISRFIDMFLFGMTDFYRARLNRDVSMIKRDQD